LQAQNTFSPKKEIVKKFFLMEQGGEKGIRTLDTLASIRAFQARALDQLCDLSYIIFC
jgi:hypothetical protein